MKRSRNSSSPPIKSSSSEKEVDERYPLTGNANHLVLAGWPMERKGEAGLVFSASPEQKKYTSSGFLPNHENGFR